MLLSALRQSVPQKLSAKAAPFLASRSFGSTVPLLKKADSVAPPVKILKKDMRPTFKSPGTSWTNFMASYLKENSMFVGAGCIKAAAAYAQLTREEKDKYAPPAEAVAEYRAKKAQWMKSRPASLKKAMKERTANSFPLGKQTAYSTFVKETYDRSRSFAENSQILSATWQALSDAEREGFKAAAERMNAESDAKKSADQ